MGLPDAIRIAQWSPGRAESTDDRNDDQERYWPESGE
jgi:hypothetical protein